jgi:tRNA (guanine37-N1)-methyltransferase
MQSAIFITMFKEPITAWLNSSIIGRAHKNGILQSKVISILEQVSFDHHQVDDTPYGGGPGELMKINIIAPLIEHALSLNNNIARSQKRVILLDPAGRVFNQEHASRLAGFQELILICGRYEGIDARIHHYVDEAISLGDFILSSGDLAAMAIFDATARMIKGVLGNEASTEQESHAHGRLEASNYTRPKEYLGHEVPLVYYSGHHHHINQAKTCESIYRTLKIRPDLLEKYPLNDEEKALFLSVKNPSYPWLKHDIKNPDKLQ